jgi:hypothetical protein
MAKKQVAPFKLVPVELREHLHELTGNELKVWLCVYLHTDKSVEGFPSNELIMEETGISERTLVTVKQGLRKKAWFAKSTQRYRDNGSLSTMSEKVALPTCKTCTYIPATIAPISPQELPLSSVQDLHLPEVDTLKVDTEKPDTSKPQKQVSSLASQLVQTPSASCVPEKQEQQNQTLQQDNTNTRLENLLDQESDLVRNVAEEILFDGILPQRLGVPYFGDVDVPDAISMAKHLIHYNRTLHWLQDMVSWMKGHSFWKKRLHAGRRAVGQLTKFVATGEIVAQFEQHLALDLGSDAISEGSAYWKCWYREEDLTPSQEYTGGFQMEEAE